jgi:uncharacterized RDD family membrane protein YckC
MKAWLVDTFYIIALAYGLPMLTSQVEGMPPFVNFAALVGPLLFLEPCLISFRGATLGQSWYGMSVLDVHTMKRCPMPRAFIRYFTKILLGGVSLVYMFFSHRYRSIHDHLAGTIVVFTSAINRYTSIPPLSMMPQRIEDETYAYPSVLRRFVVFLVWYCAMFLVVIIVFGLSMMILAPACLRDRVPSDASGLCHMVEVPFKFVLLCVFIYFAYLGAEGRLPGAKRKSKKDRGPSLDM